MLKISYDKHAGGWQKPYITPMEHLHLHPAAKVLHYATEVKKKSKFTEAVSSFFFSEAIQNLNKYVTINKTYKLLIEIINKLSNIHIYIYIYVLLTYEY